jgi:cubilin
MIISADDWKSLGKFCGRQLPPSVNTTNVSAKVRFVSNGNIDGDGFSLLWYSPCGGLFTEKSGNKIKIRSYQEN